MNLIHYNSENWYYIRFSTLRIFHKNWTISEWGGRRICISLLGTRPLILLNFNTPKNLIFSTAYISVIYCIWSLFNFQILSYITKITYSIHQLLRNGYSFLIFFGCNNLSSHRKLTCINLFTGTSSEINMYNIIS